MLGGERRVGSKNQNGTREGCVRLSADQSGTIYSGEEYVRIDARQSPCTSPGAVNAEDVGERSGAVGAGAGAQHAFIFLKPCLPGLHVAHQLVEHGEHRQERISVRLPGLTPIHWGIFEQQPTHEVGTGAGDGCGDDSAERMAHQHGRLGRDALAKGDGVRDVVLQRVGTRCTEDSPWPRWSKASTRHWFVRAGTMGSHVERALPNPWRSTTTSRSLPPESS